MEVSMKYFCIFFCLWTIKIFESVSFVETKQMENSIWSNVFSARRTHIGPIPYINNVMTEWSTWANWETCSRSCGGGIRSRTRKCATRYPRVMPGSGIRTTHDRCTGDTVQYEVCGVSACPGGARISFRASQCREHNNKKVLGRVVNNWVPYSKGGMNPCALVCEGEGEGLVYTFGKVIDGTHCTNDEGKKGLCVNGRCLRLSCDGHLGGVIQEDMCRVCGGRNDTCVRHRGVFHSERPLADQPFTPSDKKTQKSARNLGYYEVVTIPKGSTNVRVFENSSNFLALRSGGKYILNGNWLIDWPGEVDANGATFSYVRREDQSESLASLGPTTADLALMVLLREHNPGILYEYWTPNSSPTFKSILPTTAPPSDKLLSVISTSSSASTSVPDSISGDTSKSNLKPAILTELSLNQSRYQHEAVEDDTMNLNREVTRPDDLIALNYVKDMDSYSANSVLSKHETQHKETLISLPPWKPKKSKKKKTKQSLKKKKKLKNSRRPTHCDRCTNGRKTKKSFCTSDFVSRVEVLNVEEQSDFARSEVLVQQSYKNKVPLLHKEFLWQDPCHCRRLRPGKVYIVMGTTRSGRGNEVQLTLRKNSYVRRFSNKILSRIMKIRSNEMRYCSKWRLKQKRPKKKKKNKYSRNNYFVNLVHKRSNSL